MHTYTYTQTHTHAPKTVAKTKNRCLLSPEPVHVGKGSGWAEVLEVSAYQKDTVWDKKLPPTSPPSTQWRRSSKTITH